MPDVYSVPVTEPPAYVGLSPGSRLPIPTGPESTLQRHFQNRNSCFGFDGDSLCNCRDQRQLHCLNTETRSDKAQATEGQRRIRAPRIPAYENEYVKFFKNKPELPPGQCPDATTQVTPSRPDSGEAGLSKTDKCNLKEKRSQPQEKDAEALSRTLDKLFVGHSAQTPSAHHGPQATSLAAFHTPDSAATTKKAKKIKHLRKNLIGGGAAVTLPGREVQQRTAGEADMAQGSGGGAGGLGVGPVRLQE
uniref:Uncharacterized protein n=1 Tax=Rattus norvegicus TaxID=10116 RepID=A0ABK0LAZ7_RAT